MFTAEIIEDPIWTFRGGRVNVSAIVSIKNSDTVIDTKSISTKIAITAENWKDKGYNAIIEKAKDELIAYRANYTKIMTDTGFSSPTEIIADLKSKINTALAGV